MAQQTNAEGTNTGISWCDYTLNLWWGCTKVHAGCDNCYAETTSNRWGFDTWGNDKPRRLIAGWESTLNKYQKEAAAAGEIRTCFVGSMMDIFEKPMPLVDKDGQVVFDNGISIGTQHVRERLFAKISEGLYPNLLFLLLTKRPSNINKYIPESWQIHGAPANVMFGTSPVNQETADTLIPQLLQVNGRHFLSCEPLLGMIDLLEAGAFGKYTPAGPNSFAGRFDGPAVEWVITGGESGPKARPMHPDWPRELYDQCLAAGVKFHFKQWGQYREGANGGSPISSWLMVGNNGETFSGSDKIPGGIRAALMTKVGKAAAGRRLDGKEYNALATD